MESGEASIGLCYGLVFSRLKLFFFFNCSKFREFSESLREIISNNFLAFLPSPRRACGRENYIFSSVLLNLYLLLCLSFGCWCLRCCPVVSFCSLVFDFSHVFDLITGLESFNIVWIIIRIKFLFDFLNFLSERFWDVHAFFFFCLDFSLCLLFLLSRICGVRLFFLCLLSLVREK